MAWQASAPLRAVVVSTTTENTSAPDDDPGWANVGILRGSTAIYLGNRWALTAAHIGVGGATDIEFPEVGTFGIDKSSIIRLENPPSRLYSDRTDVELFRLTEDPGLPPLRIATEVPAVGTPVVAIGRGLDREDERTYWNARGRNWSEADPPGDFSGFKTANMGSTLRWGTNLLEEDELFETERDDDITTVIESWNNHDVHALITEFDFDDGNTDTSVTHNDDFMTLYESQAVLNDSGGGLFFKNGDNWELLGMAVAVERVDGGLRNPEPARAAVFGNLTFYADLVTYRDQIVSRFVYGDFDSDGVLSAADIDMLTQATLSAEYDPVFDLNRDGLVDAVDRDVWVVDVANTYFGDGNLDGEFNSSDLVLALQAAEYEDDIALNSTWATGDWDGDLDFTSGDLVKALQGGGYENGPRMTEIEVGGAVVVPEPQGWAMLLLALLMFAPLCRTPRVHIR